MIRDQQGIMRYAQNEGRQEATLKIARQFRDVLDDETIASKTQLSVEAVRNLRSQNQSL